MSRVFLIVVLSCSVVAAGEPKVLAPVSANDVHRVCELIAKRSGEVVKTIEPFLSENYVPGVTPQDVMRVSNSGKIKYVLWYPRRDRVYARTNCKRCTGAGYMYQLQKVEGQWQVLRKDRLVD
jgi:hypothetical protein